MAYIKEKRLFTDVDKKSLNPKNLPPATDIQKIKIQQEAETKKLVEEKS